MLQSLHSDWRNVPGCTRAAPRETGTRQDKQDPGLSGETLRTVTRTFAWHGVRIIPGARSLTQPAGPPGGLISRTAFWAQNVAHILAPRALHLTVGCVARGPRLWAVFGSEIWDPKSSFPKGGATAFRVPRGLKQVKLLHSNPDIISHQEATVP